MQATTDSPESILAEYLRNVSPQANTSTKLTPSDVITWGQQNFYIPTEGATPRLISFLPHQKTILRLFFDNRYAQALGCAPSFQTLVFSTIKKSGKTALAALVARWITETWGSHAEVFSLANDLEQARGRIYQAAMTSIELDPRYRRADKGIANLWRIIERQAAYLPTHSTLKAVSSDYKGEAGSNPTATFWSELWGYESEAAQRLWEELTPVPTRPRSIRYVETYAGYDGESTILNDLEDRVKGAYRLSARDLALLGFDKSDWPFNEDPLPFYVHPPTRTFAYWDSGVIARRMPWQTPQYYISQEGSLRTSAFRRLHLNERVSNDEEFIPRELWDRLASTDIPILDANTPVIVGADASVTGDSMAIVAVSRDPKNPSNLVQRLCQIWVPQNGQPLNYGLTIKPALEEWCKRYNVVQIAYDQYQLHHLMTELRMDAVAWCKPFSQNADRSIADKQLYDLIKDARIHHTGDPDLAEHIRNCAAKVPKDDNSRLRLIKKASKSKIDAAVALSMASHEALRLNL
jgi:phage terminase large subunit-like protein